MKTLTIHNPSFNYQLQEFKKDLEVKEYSKSYQTRKNAHAKEFLFFCEAREIESIQNIIAQDILDYHEYLSTRPNQRQSGTLSQSMISDQVGSLKRFFEFLEDTGVIDSSPVNLSGYQKAKHKERSIASREEISELYALTKDSREKAILSLSYGCGLRRSEMQKLNVSDVMFEKGILIVRNGKNAKSRRVPMSDTVIKDLKTYLRERQRYIKSYAHYSDGFLVGEWGRRLSGQMILLIFKKLVRRTQNLKLFKKRICLHSMRHSIATHLLDNGATIDFVQRFLGHSGIDMAHHYSKKRKQRMMLKDSAEKHFNPSNDLSYE